MVDSGLDAFHISSTFDALCRWKTMHQVLIAPSTYSTIHQYQCCNTVSPRPGTVLAPHHQPCICDSPPNMKHQSARHPVSAPRIHVKPFAFPTIITRCFAVLAVLDNRTAMTLLKSSNIHTACSSKVMSLLDNRMLTRCILILS